MMDHKEPANLAILIGKRLDGHKADSSGSSQEDSSDKEAGSEQESMERSAANSILSAIKSNDATELRNALCDFVELYHGREEQEEGSDQNQEGY